MKLRDVTSVAQASSYRPPRGADQDSARLPASSSLLNDPPDVLPPPAGRSKALTAPVVPGTASLPPSISSRLSPLILDRVQAPHAAPSPAPTEATKAPSVAPLLSEPVPVAAAMESESNAEEAPKNDGVEQLSATAGPLPEPSPSLPKRQTEPPATVLPEPPAPVAMPPLASRIPTEPVLRPDAPQAPIQTTALRVEPKLPEKKASTPGDSPQILAGRMALEGGPAVDWSRVPRNAEMLTQIGAVALQAGSTEVGLRWLRAALQVDPQYAPAHKALLEYYQSKGDTFRAAEHRAQAGTP